MDGVRECFKVLEQCERSMLGVSVEGLMHGGWSDGCVRRRCAMDIMLTHVMRQTFEREVFLSVQLFVCCVYVRMSVHEEVHSFVFYVFQVWNAFLLSVLCVCPLCPAR